MTRLFKLPAGIDYPATLADYRLCVAKKPHKRTSHEEAETIAAPYPEIIPSWLANGVEEVTSDD